ncbi:MAG: hypothetical protein RI957_1666, partial [Verrucomicrobiota bacterium]
MFSDHREFGIAKKKVAKRAPMSQILPVSTFRSFTRFENLLRRVPPFWVIFDPHAPELETDIFSHHAFI